MDAPQMLQLLFYFLYGAVGVIILVLVNRHYKKKTLKLIQGKFITCPSCGSRSARFFITCTHRSYTHIERDITDRPGAPDRSYYMYYYSLYSRCGSCGREIARLDNVSPISLMPEDLSVGETRECSQNHFTEFLKVDQRQNSSCSGAIGRYILYFLGVGFILVGWGAALWIFLTSL